MTIKIKATLTRADLREKVYIVMPQLSRQQTRVILDEVFEEILKTLEHNEPVKIHGFGHFKLQHKRQRIGRNPKSGNDAIITARRVVKFAPSSQLIAKINGNFYDANG